jgi:sulfate-transporting ATPase
MNIAIQFAILGLGLGAIYTLLAQGLVFIHWGSGVINLAHLGIAMFAAFIYFQLTTQNHWTMWPALAVCVAGSAVFGALIYQLIMRPLRHRSTLARVVATLGVLILLQGLAQVIWGTSARFVSALLPVRSWTVHGIHIPVDRVWLLVIGFGLTLALWVFVRFTTVGLAITAGSENPRAAAARGWSPDNLATLTWSVGAGLAGLAGVLLAPLIGITTDEMPLLVIPALAAALIGGFTSFWLTLIGALFVGVLQSEIIYYVHATGADWAIPFVIIVLLLAVRGKGLPTRGYFAERLPAVGTGRISWTPLIVTFFAFAACFLWFFPTRLVDGLTVSLGWATIMLSVVVLLGYTGQLSFEQMAMGGLTALIAGRMVVAGVPFVFAIILGLLCAVPIGVIFALPALRTRGVNLAVVTLAMGMVVYQMIFENQTYTGGADGTPVGYQTFLGIPIDSIRHAKRYGVFALVLFTLCALMVANVRRGSSGRRLLAVRSNERAAAALGVSVFEGKLFAFILGAALSGIGGILIAFQQVIVAYEAFNPFNGILAVAYAVIGGVGFVLGAVFGGTMAPGGFGYWLMTEIWQNPLPAWLAVLGGIAVIKLLITYPDGAIAVKTSLFRKLRHRFRAPSDALPLPPPGPPRQVDPATLEINGLTVRYGPTVAVDDVSMTVAPGEIVGLIGPNGAGKTSLIDAVTGFTPMTSGTILLSGTRIDKWPVHKRARAGVSRSFQSLELFEQSTVRENLQVGADAYGLGVYVKDLVRPRQHELPPEAVAAVREFELESDLDRQVVNLPHGRRRLVAVARAVAFEPSVLLLDEPAAGLSGQEAAELAETLRRLAVEWGIAILLVEHNMQFVMSVCDRITVIEFGRQIATGTPDQVRNDRRVIAAYLGHSEHEPVEAVEGPLTSVAR